MDPVVKNMPATAGDNATEQLSPSTTANEPGLWSPRAAATEARAPWSPAPQRDGPRQWEAREPLFE